MKYRPNSHKAVNHPRRTTRQLDAAERQVERSKLSPKQQLAVLANRPGESKREVTRLKKALSV